MRNKKPFKSKAKTGNYGYRTECKYMFLLQKEADEGEGGELVLSVLIYFHFYWKESCYLKLVSWGDKGIDASL